jgi:hypothetical protein
MGEETMRHSQTRAALLVVAAAIIPACGGGNGGRSVQSPSDLPTCVVPGTGHLTVSAKGAEGTGGLGGAGGNVEVVATSGSDLKLLSGAFTVDASFTPPAFTPFLGTNPRTFMTPGPVTLTTTINSTTILGDDGVTAATGLRVGPGVLLTITTNLPDLPALRTTAAIAFPHAIWIEGQVTTANADLTVPGDAGSNNAGGLQLAGSNLLLSTGAAIVTVGRAGASLLPDGGNGGTLFANIGSMIVNKGTITTAGADGFTSAGNGGKGGRVTFWSGTFLYSTGPITTDGGTGRGPGTAGGAGGQIVLIGAVALSFPSEHGGCFVRGTLSARGGDGTAAGGAGPSGPIPGLSGTFGVFLGNPANPLGGRGVYDVVIDASGGDATVDGNGGDGAAGSFAGVVLRAEGGTLQAKATITNRGGAGADTGAGGAGGSVLITQILGNGAGSLGFGSKPDLEGGMAVAAAIDTGGGAGSDGGSAGNVTFAQSLDGIPSGRNPLILAGYKLIETSGGDGQTAGGAAGSIRILNHVHTDDSGLTAIGAILNEVELKARGGAGTDGGTGGAVTLRTDSPSQLLQERPDPDRSVTNLGLITTIGGAGVLNGAVGGVVSLYDHRAVNNSAAITTNGGNGLSTNGGAAAVITLESERAICNSGPLTAQGGAGGAEGGDGGTITLRNLTVLSLEPDSSVCNSAPLNASGGSGAEGGAGGNIHLYAHLSLTNEGTLTADGGAASAGKGGVGGIVTLGSDAELSNTAAAFARGGDSSAGNGGVGGFLFFVADRTTSHGNLTATGGDGTVVGGAGGFIQVYSVSPPSIKTGTFTVAPGTGGTPAAGAIDVDGIDQPLIGGVITF